MGRPSQVWRPLLLLLQLCAAPVLAEPLDTNEQLYLTAGLLGGLCLLLCMAVVYILLAIYRLQNDVKKLSQANPNTFQQASNKGGESNAGFQETSSSPQNLPPQQQQPQEISQQQHPLQQQQQPQQQQQQQYSQQHQQQSRQEQFPSTQNQQYPSQQQQQHNPLAPQLSQQQHHQPAPQLSPQQQQQQNTRRQQQLSSSSFAAYPPPQAAQEGSRSDLQQRDPRQVPYNASRAEQRAPSKMPSMYRQPSTGSGQDPSIPPAYWQPNSPGPPSDPFMAPSRQPAGQERNARPVYGRDRY